MTIHNHMTHLRDDTSHVTPTDLVSLVTGAWSTRVTVVSNTAPFPAPGSYHWGLTNFTADGLIVTLVNFGSRGCGVWQALPNSTRSIAFSFILQNFRAGNWVGNLHVYAPRVDFAPDGSSFTAQNIQCLQRDQQGVAGNQMSISLQGTRITITTPDQQPVQSQSL